MDNASKSLLMAGSILIAILLISFGRHLFNSGTVLIGDTGNQLLTRAINNYNQRYLGFVGTEIKSSDAKQLIQIIDNHNRNKDEVRSYGKVDKFGITDTKDIFVGKTYNVEITYYNKQGAIAGMKITQN